MSEAVQLSFFATGDGRMQTFMQRFAAIDFGKPDPWCHCNRCTYARMTAEIREGTMSAAVFLPHYQYFLNECATPAVKGCTCAWCALFRLCQEYYQ